MSTKTRSASDLTEACEDCGHDTPHSVSIELRTESDKHENREFSREPYRITECMACGSETALRMNNA
ncbi:DUF7835 family putative zinc beta-ribbon protein [Halococcus sediminicola]|uniref:DUF7835 family putative zinc beta-ribbon protein n=1 Tax=Halococcus sediminicola TaxID=1264579 RepID=UPI00067877B5|nr:hypothetical protein [Halococcus sediminicola]